jgi:hypothetical protein
MSNFTFNIKGLLHDMKLAESKAMWPLFEAVVNAIQAIEDSTNKEKGKITVFVHRENTRVEAGEMSKVSSEKIEDFSITDNGIGLDTKNYESFLSAYSTHKVQKGCKGIGRFLWLKAFGRVEIKSVFCENGVYYRREFTFSEEGVTPENNVQICDETETGTTVKLVGFLGRYKNSSPVELDVIATKLIEHCLLFFICGNCPQITLMDGINDTINLNSYYTNNIKDSLHQDPFSIKGHSFILYHLQVPEGANNHELHFCANMHEVKSVELSKAIPDLRKKIIPNDTTKPFYYAGYLTGEYLDSIVNTTRTAFEYDEKDANLSLHGTGEDSITATAMEFVRGYLSDYIAAIEKKKIDQINRFVAENKPTYRYLLNTRPEVYKMIPADLSNDMLELELHKQVQQWEHQVFKKGQLLEQQAKDQIDQDDATYQKLFEVYWKEVTELSKTSLAEYVTRRKAILKMLESILEITEDGHFKKEETIHSIICPMQHTSDDVRFEEMNLWLVDERLAYHRFLASDKTLKSMPFVDSKSTKEPDIAIFDQAFAYSDSDEPFSSITIIEFKKPDNDTKSPINQVWEYIDLIRSGKKRKMNGQAFSVTEGTIFRCYVICDLTTKMRTHCLNAVLTPMADNLGYSGYNPTRKAYTEVISYSKLLADAKKRNEILFDKLFKPRIGEVIHILEHETETKD